MNQQENEQYVSYRIKKSRTTLEEVDILIQNELWNISVNRLYYACFYAVIALLGSKQIYPRSHSGAIQMFSLNFVVPGIFSKENARFYTKLFDMRQKGDYEDIIDYEKDTVLLLVEPAKAFIGQIENLLNLPGT